MVLPLRFPPGMAGGLLLAYPRMKKPDHSGVVIACLAACVTFSPYYNKVVSTPTFGRDKTIWKGKERSD